MQHRVVSWSRCSLSTWTLSLPCDPEPWERYPDSNGEGAKLSRSGHIMSWNSEKRRRRRHLPQNAHEGSSDAGDDSDGETLMMGGIFGRSVRNPEAQLNRPDSAVEPIGVSRVSVETSTMDDIPFKKNAQGFLVRFSNRCIICRLGAPEALKVYDCQPQGCDVYTCIRCAVPLQLTNCRQGLLCARHFPSLPDYCRKWLRSAEGLDVFDDDDGQGSQ
eukprot:831347-Amphidinium_carterae.1